MSTEATWDLRASSSPRSLCVLAAAEILTTSHLPNLTNTWSLTSPSSLNPFDPAPTNAAGGAALTPSVSSANADAMAVIFGTDQGSMHFRTFASPHRFKRPGLSSVSSTSASSSSSASAAAASSASLRVKLPLGVTVPASQTGTTTASSTASSSSNLPRALYPVDWAAGSLPGSVQACIRVLDSTSSSSGNSNSTITFLLLLDDQRGPSAQQPGTYASALVSLSAGAFHLLATSHSSSSSSSNSNSSTTAASVTSKGIGAGGAVTLPPLPRMSCAASQKSGLIVFAAGRSLATLSPEYYFYSAAATAWEDDLKGGRRSGGMPPSARWSGRLSASGGRPASLPWPATTWFGPSMGHILPAPGVRSGPESLTLTATQGQVAVLAVGNAFYAVAGREEAIPPAASLPTSALASQSADSEATPSSASSTNSHLHGTGDCIKILSFAQSSQVHPVIVMDVLDTSMDTDWSCLFMASGRECAVVDLYYGPVSSPRLMASKPRHGLVTVASPILSSAVSYPWLAILTSDGLISIRSPSCLAVPLRTVEVGQRPNDYFTLRTLRNDNQAIPWIVAAAYSGEGKVLQCQPDSEQDLADRLMRHAIDAFGANNFPRAELAEAVNATFTATSYVGPEASPQARSLLKQYLEAVLGLIEFESGASSVWPTESSGGEGHHGTFASGSIDLQRPASFSGRGATPNVITSATPAALLTGTALLCLVCSQLSPPNSGLANSAAQSCAEKMGIVADRSRRIPDAAVRVCELIADKLLREASSTFSLLSGSSPSPISRIQRGTQASVSHTDFIETAIWLLRACGRHEQAIEVTYERLQQQSHRDDGSAGGRLFWSQIKYESYTATHLCELWSAGTEETSALVIRSPATRRILESNPSLGLSVFTSLHPQNETQWREMQIRDDPLADGDNVYKVLNLLKSISPSIPMDRESVVLTDKMVLPLDSGRAMAVNYLESAIGISTGRPTEPDEFDTLPLDEQFEEHVANVHDELSFLLLEGVLSERRDDAKDDSDSDIGLIYRNKLRRLLKWPLARIRPDRFMEALPQSFLQEKALILGRVGRHEDALRILYRDLQSLDLALEYCDGRHELQKAQLERLRARQPQSTHLFEDEGFVIPQQDNAYIPLVRVALDSDDLERGTAAAIQVLTLRRGAIDLAASLRLLPAHVPVSAVARPFLIPALVDSESQVRRLSVVSALLRSKYLRLKEQLTAAQLKAQAHLPVVPQLRSLNLGDPLHSTQPFRARTSAAASSTMPEVMIVKHFFPRHLVIQAKVTNLARLSEKQQQRTLTDVAFVVAESSEDAIQPLLQVPIQVLPSSMTGSAWCVLSASPGRMESSTAQLTCELRYTVQAAGDAALLVWGGVTGHTLGRTYVEELQDLEVQAAHFS